MASRYLALLGICASLAMNSIARADATFTLTVLETTETTELVRISVQDASPAASCLPAFCSGVEWKFTMTPCPASPACSDSYVSGWNQTYMSIDLPLRRGETYTFDGSVRTRVGTTEQFPCEFICPDLQDITTRVHATAPPPAIVPEWNISVVTTENNIVWVDIRMVNTSAQNRCTQGGYCKVVQTIHCEVSPCPPVVPPTCFGSYTLVIGSRDDVFRFGLATGTTYTISGSFGTRGYDTEEEGGCQYVTCWTDEYPLVKTYKASTLAVTPTTWGAVKALYRAP